MALTKEEVLIAAKVAGSFPAGRAEDWHTLPKDSERGKELYSEDAMSVTYEAMTDDEIAEYG